MQQIIEDLHSYDSSSSIWTAPAAGRALARGPATTAPPDRGPAAADARRHRRRRHRRRRPHRRKTSRETSSTFAGGATAHSAASGEMKPVGASSASAELVVEHVVEHEAGMH